MIISGSHLTIRVKLAFTVQNEVRVRVRVRVRNEIALLRMSALLMLDSFHQ